MPLISQNLESLHWGRCYRIFYTSQQTFASRLLYPSGNRSKYSVCCSFLEIVSDTQIPHSHLSGVTFMITNRLFIFFPLSKRHINTVRFLSSLGKPAPVQCFSLPGMRLDFSTRPFPSSHRDLRKAARKAKSCSTYGSTSLHAFKIEMLWMLGSGAEWCL